jgi:hypothetical protein
MLKYLTPKKIEKEVIAIQAIKLPQEIEKWAKEYKNFGARNDFFLKFIYKLNQIIDPFSISNKSILEIKTLIILFIILVDDVAEKNINKNLLKQLIKITEGNIVNTNLTLKEKEYLNFATKLWKYIQKNIARFTFYENFKEIFYYDMKQVINAIEYSNLINKNLYLINKEEHWAYAPHTLQGLVNCTIDLMNLNNFDIKNLGRLRKIFLNAQKMARIANCLGTWEKEINENDFTNTVFTYAVESNLINIGELSNKKNIIYKIKNSKIKKELLKEWRRAYNEINYLCKKNSPIDCSKFLQQVEKLSVLYLINGELSK